MFYANNSTDVEKLFFYQSHHSHTMYRRRDKNTHTRQFQIYIVKILLDVVRPIDSVLDSAQRLVLQ